MDKTVDLNERALEKEKKDFVKLCKMLEVGARTITILILIAVPVFILAIGLDALNIVVEIEGFMAEDYIMLGCATLLCVCFGIGLNFIANVFRKMRIEETPFRYDVADKMKGAGVAFVVAGGLAFIFNVTLMILNGASVLDFADVPTYPDFFSFVLGVFLLALAYVFNYGCKLQQEADETI